MHSSGGFIIPGQIDNAAFSVRRAKTSEQDKNSEADSSREESASAFGFSGHSAPMADEGGHLDQRGKTSATLRAAISRPCKGPDSARVEFLSMGTTRGPGRGSSADGPKG